MAAASPAVSHRHPSSGTCLAPLLRAQGPPASPALWWHQTPVSSPKLPPRPSLKPSGSWQRPAQLGSGKRSTSGQGGGGAAGPSGQGAGREAPMPWHPQKCCPHVPDLQGEGEGSWAGAAGGQPRCLRRLCGVKGKPSRPFPFPGRAAWAPLPRRHGSPWPPLPGAARTRTLTLTR